MEYSNLKSTVAVGEAVSKSWNAVKYKMGLFIGFTVLYYIVIGIVQKIPIIGGFSTLISFIYPVSIYNGLQTLDKNRSMEFNDFFNWGPKFGQFVLANLVIILLAVVFFLPVIVMIIYLFGADTMWGLYRAPQYVYQISQDISAGYVFIMIILSLVIGIIFSMLEFAFMFIIQFKDMSIGDALRLSWAAGKKNIGSIILLGFASAGILILGFLALIVGIVVAIPVVMGAKYYFLKGIFPDEKREEWDFMKEEVSPEI